ncbi:MAG: MFS transporter [Verrucomicrobia bacterium]|nr:MFS transporter [Verrucomicrobiota bacterium]
MTRTPFVDYRDGIMTTTGQINAKRQFITILLIVFCGFLGISMPYLLFPALFINPEYSILPQASSHASRALLLGLTLAVYPLGQFLGSPILGSLSDDFGRKPLLSGSLLVAAFCNLVTGLALAKANLLLIILSRFAAGMMEGNVAIARAMAADIKTMSKHDTFGKINAAISIAFLIGPLIGGVLADNQIFEGATISTPFYVIGALFFALSIMAAAILHSHSVAASAKKGLSSYFNLFKKMKALFRDKQLKFLMIVSTFFTLAVDIFYEFGPVYLTEKWTLRPADLIIYNSILCLTLAIGNGWLASFFSKRYTTPPGVIGAIGGFSLFLLSTIFTNQPWLMMVFIGLCGLLIGLGVTLLTVRISDAATDAIQGEVLGVQLSLRVLGDAIICILGGILLLISPKLILAIAALIAAATMGYYIRRK